MRTVRRPPTIVDMELVTTIMAATSWPDAAIAIAGVALVASVAVVVVWQALATWRARIAATRDDAYRRLAEQTLHELWDINERLNRIDPQSHDKSPPQADVETGRPPHHLGT
jgi:hypothetical protein